MPIEYGLGASTIDYDGKNIYIRITDIDDETSEFDFNKISSPSFYENKYLLKDGDILVARTGASVGKSYLHSNLPNSYFAGFLMRVRVSGHDPYFIYSQLKTNKFKKWLQIMSIRSGQPGINSKELGLYKIFVTDIKKEEKIGNIIKNIDQIIITQKKIIEDLNRLKMSINSQASKQKGIIFKIKNICEIGRGRVISNEEIKKQQNPIYPVFSSQTQNNGIMGYLDGYEFDGEYITWTTDGANAGTIFYHNEKFNCTNVCGTLKVNNKDVSAKYLSSILPYYVKKYVSKNLANPKLMNNTMSNIEVNIIPKIKQIKFINAITSIEEKINNEKSILELFIKQKEYLLNKLFI